MRIVGGTFGGRRLSSPGARQTRPSSERLREGLFSALDARGLIEDASVLDLFAGSGLLGLEALSRGARGVVAVDSAPVAVRCIAENARALGVQDAVRALRLDLSKPGAARRLGALPEAPFGLLLCDPPYAGAASVGPLLEALAATPSALAVDAVVAVEHAAGAAPPAPASFEHLASYRYGGSAVSLWRRTAPRVSARPDPW